MISQHPDLHNFPRSSGSQQFSHCKSQHQISSHTASTAKSSTLNETHFNDSQ